MQSFKDLTQLLETKEQKINNSLIIKYNKLIISDVDNLLTYLIKQVYNSQIITHSDKTKIIKLLNK